jgi:hypothetical protein
MSFFAKLRVVLVLVVVLVLLGYFIGNSIKTSHEMPDHARVLMDDDRHTFLCPPYREQYLEEYPSAHLRTATAHEALTANYLADEGCRDTTEKEGGGFSQEGRTLSGIVLEYLGAVPPLRSRWNEDGTWNW